MLKVPLADVEFKVTSSEPKAPESAAPPVLRVDKVVLLYGLLSAVIMTLFPVPTFLSENKPDAPDETRVTTSPANTPEKAAPPVLIVV